MTKVRVATFNCENLFARYKFDSKMDPAKASVDGFTIDRTRFDILNATEKELTARAILEAKADVLALQEVENLEVLRRFRSTRLAKAKYTHAMLIDGPDPRQIDVALLSRFPIVKVRSYQHLRVKSASLFSRDCLEVDVEVAPGKTLTLFVNHLKSMFERADVKNGRKKTRARRMQQAQAVRKIVTDRFGATPGDAPWVVLGDLNDYAGEGDGTTSAIDDLVNWNQLENVIDRLPQADRWTHFHDTSSKPEDERYKQLDYVLVSRALAQQSASAPALVRGGLTPRALRATQARFDGVTKKLVASDHCPLVITLEV